MSPHRVLLAASLLFFIDLARAEQPKVTDERLVLELVASEPEVVTPTGIAVDEQGRVWVIENNTHHRPKEYKGPTSDRVRVFSDFDEKGKAKTVITWAEGFKDAMSLAFGPDGSLYLATRAEIFLLRGKDKMEDRRSLLKLDTKGNYPHNGLCGFAFDGTGNMYFGMGENLGEPYKLVGSDGVTLTGGGEGGNMFTCRPDGTKLSRVATGFWNPFHHCFDAFGRLFVVDNDPDSRGPCRLLHVVPGGDYGYRFRYGRKGTHPFQAWNGELPGTLGMVAGTGEAPSGVVAYESTGLPADYRGKLLATSWGDHVVEHFELVPNGASFTAKPHTIVRGGEDFRPVGIAVGPDGTAYLSDWVDKSYPVHGKGRVWRIRMRNPPADDGLRPSKVAALAIDRLGPLLGHPKHEIRTAAARALASKGPASKEFIASVLKGKSDKRAKLHALWAAALLGRETSDIISAAKDDAEPEVRAEAIRLLPADADYEARRLERVKKDPVALVRMQALLHLQQDSSLKEVIPLLADADPFIVGAAVNVLGRPGKSPLLLPHAAAANPRLRLGALLALRRTGDKQGQAALGRFLKDADPEVRRTAIQWVGEERLKDYADQLDASATLPPVNPALFQALLAAKHLLAGGKPDAEPFDEKLLAKVIDDAAQPATFRVLALQMLPASHPALSAAKLSELLTAKEADLRRQASRSLALRTDKASLEVLVKLATDSNADLPLRSDAVLGLAPASGSADVQRLLVALLDRSELRRDALRSLRGTATRSEAEKSLLEWWDRTASAADNRSELAAQMLLALKGSKTPEAEKRLNGLSEVAGPRPQSEAEWRALLEGRGDAAAGEQVFFHANGPRCYSCHRVDGRGGKIGPDLSTIGRALNRERMIESILAPSKEIAPMFVSWSIATRDGKVRVGVIVEERFDSTIVIGDAQGRLETIKRQDIEERVALTTSIMPDNLHEQMTPREFVDLLAYLLALK